MNTKTINKLRNECAEFDMDFNPEFFSREEDVKHVIRWSKSRDKPSRNQVREKLCKLGCYAFIRPEPVNLDWL